MNIFVSNSTICSICEKESIIWAISPEKSNRQIICKACIEKLGQIARESPEILDKIVLINAIIDNFCNEGISMEVKR